MAHGHPRLYIIAGPNGAGKTTFARRFLPHYAGCIQFVNADLIAEGLSPFSPDTAAFQAGRVMLAEIRRLADARRDFAFETTLAGKSYLPFLRALKDAGYSIHLLFLWLDSVELALARIADRVRDGGHDVPEAVVRRRFDKGLRNLLKYYRPFADSCIIFDNSAGTPQVIAYETQGQMEIVRPNLFAKLLEVLEA
ncbi:MAG: Zeta toxin family protein [Planctomycetes bacterium]|nr:Zeta toxin family protein [Planctomycetota bacterium]